MSNTQWSQNGSPQQYHPGGYQQVPKKKNWLPLGIGVAIVLLIVLVVLLVVLFSGGDGDESAPVTSSSASATDIDPTESSSGEPSETPSESGPGQPSGESSPVPGSVAKPLPKSVRDSQLTEEGEAGALQPYYITQDSVAYTVTILTQGFNMEVIVGGLSQKQSINGWTCGIDSLGDLQTCAIQDPEDGLIVISNGRNLKDLAAWGEEFRKAY